MSAQGDHVECSTILLKCGADINDTTTVSLMHGFPLCVIYLSVSRWYRINISCCCLFSWSWALESSPDLMKAASIEPTVCVWWIVTQDSLTPLHIASHYGHLRTAKLLVDNNCNINALAPVSDLLSCHRLVPSSFSCNCANHCIQTNHGAALVVWNSVNTSKTKC